MPSDLILLHAPSVYDFRQKTILYGPVSEKIQLELPLGQSKLRIWRALWAWLTGK